jgi:WD40 repeat protein
MLRPLHELTGHAKQVVGLRWGSRESELWSAGGDGSITVWNAFEAKSERTVTCSGVEALGADWNPDGTEIAFCCWNRIVLADTQSGGRLADWYASRGVFGGFGELIKWSDDGARLSMALTSWSAPVPVWDVETMKRKHGDVAAGAPAKPIPSRQLPWMDWSKDGDVIASCAVDEIKIWDARRQQLLRTIDVRDAPSSCGRISPDGQRLAVAFRDVATKHLRVYALMDGAEIWSADLPQQGYSVDWSADGEWLAVASNADAPSPVHVLSASGRQLDVQYGTSMSYSHIAFEPAGKRLALADGYRIMIREAGATDGTLVMRGENYARNLMRWSRDGRRLACNMSEGLIRVATLGPEPSVIRLEGHSTHVTCLSWSWNDQRLASLDETGTLKVWDVAEGREILSLPNQAISLAWDPTGARLAYLPANGDLGVLDATPSYDREAPPEYLPVFERGLVTTPGDEPLRRSAAIALTRAGHWDRAAETIVGGDARDATLFQPGWWLVAQPETGADRQDADVARNRWPLGARWYRPIDPANGHVPTGGLTGTFWSRIYVPRETEAALVIGDGYAESYLLNGVALDLTAAKAAAGSNPICKLASLESGWNELAAIVPAEAEGDRFAFFCARISLDPIDLALAYADAGLGDKSATASAAVSDTQRDDPRLLRALQRR